MTPTEITRIRALAEKATLGPWDYDSGFLDDAGIHRYSVVSADNGDTVIAGEVNNLIADNGSYIAAIDPATVKQLCETALRNTAQAQVTDADLYELLACVRAVAEERAGGHWRWAQAIIDQWPTTLSASLPDGRS